MDQSEEFLRAQWRVDDPICSIGHIHDIRHEEPVCCREIRVRLKKKTRCVRPLYDRGIRIAQDDAQLR